LLTHCGVGIGVGEVWTGLKVERLLVMM